MGAHRHGLQVHMMVRFAAAVAILVCFVALTGCSSFGVGEPDVAVKVKPQVSDSALVSPKTLTVALATADAPRSMTDAEGNMTGYYADLAHALAKELGLDIAFVKGSAAAIGAGEADAIMGASTASTNENVKVVAAVLEDASAIFARGTARQKVSVEQLAGARVGVQDSSAAQDALSKAGIAAEFSTYANVNECFDALEAGEVDYVACDAVAGAYLARAYKEVAFAGSLDAVTAAGVGVSSSNRELADRLSQALASLEKDGRLEAIHTMWFGSLPLSLKDTLLAGVTLGIDPDDASGRQSGDDAASHESEGFATGGVDTGLDLSGINEL